MTKVVRPLVSSDIDSWMYSSDSESRAEVASSRIKIGESFNIALAIAILCLCPPDKRTPSSPTTVSYPSGIALTNSSA